MNGATLLWGLLFGSIGVGYFIYGRRQGAPMAFICGLLLIGYTWFIDDTLAIVGIGIVLMAIPYFVRL